MLGTEYRYTFFLDFQAAYDNVWRNEIWSEMHKLGFPKKLVNLCRILNNEIYAKVKIGKHLSPKFEVMKGLRQGDAIAPLLFNVVLEIAIRRSKVETKGTNFDKCSQIMAYTDDVVIMGRKLQDVKEVFTSLIEQANKMGLEINEKKTKFMTVSRKPYNENENVKMGTYNFEIVKDYTCLGTVLTNENELRPEIEKRIAMQIEHTMHFFLY
jgi:sorting nexin-29